MLNEKVKPPYKSDKSLFPKLLWHKSRLRLRFEGSCLKQENTAPFTPNNAANLFIVYELDRWSRDLNTDIALKDCLFGAVKLTKNTQEENWTDSVHNHDNEHAVAWAK